MSKAISAALAECETNLKKLTDGLSEAARTNPFFGTSCGEIRHPVLKEHCQKIYQLALNVGAVEILPNLNTPGSVGPGPSVHEVMIRWNILAEWCRSKAKEEKPVSGSAHNPIENGWEELITSPPLPASQIAEKLNQPIQLVERVLRYHRGKTENTCCVEDDNARKGTERFLYKMPDVVPILQRWCEKRAKKPIKPSV